MTLSDSVGQDDALSQTASFQSWGDGAGSQGISSGAIKAGNLPCLRLVFANSETHQDMAFNCKRAIDRPISSVALELCGPMEPRAARISQTSGST